MKRVKLTMKQLVIILVVFSAIMYVVHYLIFHDFHHIAIFFVHDIAFLPLEVILVSLGFDKMIERTNEAETKSRLSIIETLFFNQSGDQMLRYLIRFDPNSAQLKEALCVTESWRSSDFAMAARKLDAYPFSLELEQIDFFGMHYHLNERVDFYRNILENPATTQSDEFTAMVMNIYLLWEELDCRTDLYNLSSEERNYLGELLLLIYRELVEYWLDNAYNHSLHNRPRLRRLVSTNPFAA